ncbi:MAG: hypothetical protein RL095_675 [Verrucomicrobiota bacterium]|jgi:hypothetical protein
MSFFHLLILGFGLGAIAAHSGRKFCQPQHQALLRLIAPLAAIGCILSFLGLLSQKTGPDDRQDMKRELQGRLFGIEKFGLTCGKKLPGMKPRVIVVEPEQQVLTGEEYAALQKALGCSSCRRLSQAQVNDATLQADADLIILMVDLPEQAEALEDLLTPEGAKIALLLVNFRPGQLKPYFDSGRILCGLRTHPDYHHDPNATALDETTFPQRYLLLTSP